MKMLIVILYLLAIISSCHGVRKAYIEWRWPVTATCR